MQKITELKQERAELLKKQRKLVDRAEEEDRGLNSDEEDIYKKREKKIDNLEEEIKSLEEEIEADKKAIQKEVGGLNMKQDTLLLTRDQKIQDHIDTRNNSGKEVRAGKFFAGLMTGNWEGREEERALLQTSPDTSGGVVVPEEISSQILDLARSKSVLINAGARTVKMNSSDMKIGAINEDPGVAWVAEAATWGGSTDGMSFSSVDLSAKTLMSLQKMSVELVEDGKNLEQLVEDTMSKALAAKLDESIIVGAANGPTGIYENTDIGTTSAVGALSNYSPFNSAITTIKTNNHEPNAVIFHPRTEGDLNGLTATNDQPLQPLPSYAELNKYATTSIPVDQGTENNESFAIVGDFSSVIIGLRTENYRVEVFRQGDDGTDNAMTDLLVFIRSYLRACAGLAYTDAFHILDGITS